MFLLSCNGQNNEVSNKANIARTFDNFEVSDVSDYSHIQETNYNEEPEDSESKETRIRFKNFILVIHDFKGYEISIKEMTEKEDGIEERTYWGQFGGGSDLNQATLNDNEIENEDYKETLIVLTDTLHLSESLVMGGNDNKINQTLFQIIPKIYGETYQISFCYLTSLYEMFQDRNLSEIEFEKRYKNRFFKKEHTDFVSIKDSLKLYFPLTLLSDHNEQAWYTNGTMSKSFYDKELERIKNKYSLSDTLIEFSGEGGASYATLNKDKRIFGYDTYAYLFKIDRLKDKKVLETKYIVIYIAYGC
jgi:hypothetical protein